MPLPSSNQSVSFPACFFTRFLASTIKASAIASITCGRLLVSGAFLRAAPPAATGRDSWTGEHEAACQKTAVRGLASGRSFLGFMPSQHYGRLYIPQAVCGTLEAWLIRALSCHLRNGARQGAFPDI